MPEPVDYNEAGEIFKKSMQDALAHLDKVSEDAHKAHEVAIDLQIAAKEEIKRIEREAHLISEAYIDKHRKEYEARIHKEIQFSMIKKLISNGLESVKIMKLFEIERSIIADAWFELGFDKLGNHVANVGYEEQGRSGNVVFYREDINLRFWYEFGTGLTLAFIDVPKEENWTSITGLPLEDRLPILNFIGERVVRDRAPGYRFEIKEDSIKIIT